MRVRSNLPYHLLVATIIRFVLIGECIAFPIWGLSHAARTPARTQMREGLTALKPAEFCSISVSSRGSERKDFGYPPSSLVAEPLADFRVKSAVAAPMDPLSRQLFGSRDVSFSYSHGQAAHCRLFEKFLFGKLLSKLDYTELVAAPSGSRILVRPNLLPQTLDILVTNPLYKGAQVRSLFLYRGHVEMENAGWIVRDTAPDGLATRVVGRQVYMAHRIGVHEIGVYGAGSYGDPHFNGYYTWPRLGFNVQLASYKEPLEADGFYDVKDTNDLFSRPGGPEWWKRNGKDCRGLFDLDPESTSSIVLKRYLKAKGAVPYEGAD